VLAQLPIDANTVPGLVDRVTDTLDLKDAKATYAGMAAKAEFEHLLLMAEATYAKTDRYVMGDHTFSSFLSAGWKFNRRFMTHLTYAQTKETLADDARDDLDYVATHSPGLSSDYIAASLNSQVAMSVAQNRRSWTLGTRYDLTSNIALKFDVMQFEEKASYETETMGIGKNAMVRAALNAVY
ncbi:MAG TPA: hypothetical protein VFM46_18030, partial [Pseudomonadales bacterium]|nr:hypothetical protein [Pseudomonadales bacterium]